MGRSWPSLLTVILWPWLTISFPFMTVEIYVNNWEREGGRKSTCRKHLPKQPCFRKMAISIFNLCHAQNGKAVAIFHFRDQRIGLKGLSFTYSLCTAENDMCGRGRKSNRAICSNQNNCKCSVLGPKKGRREKRVDSLPQNKVCLLTHAKCFLLYKQRRGEFVCVFVKKGSVM